MTMQDGVVKNSRADRIIKITARCIGAGLVVAGVIHWLIILGFMDEEAPTLIRYYFHSLALLSPAAGYGVWKMEKWGRALTLGIAMTQFPAHGWILIEQVRKAVPLESWRFIDLGLCAFLLVFLTLPKVKPHFRKVPGTQGTGCAGQK